MATKSEIVEAVAQITGVSKADAHRAVDAVFVTIADNLARGEDVRLLPIRLSPTPTICSVSPWTAGKGRRRRIEEAIRLILDCSENRTGV